MIKVSNISHYIKNTKIILSTVAVVTISTLTGDNELIKKASEAQYASKEAEIKEKIMLAVTNARANKTLLIDRNILDEELKKEFGENNYELLLVGEGFLISVNNIEYLVDKDGIVNVGNKIEVSSIENAGDLCKGGQYDGTTLDKAYRITCIEDLLEWSNNPNNYLSKNLKLENTIDFNSTASYKNARAKTTDINGNGKIEELITELTTGKGFKTISRFYGTFDGQNNEIRNIYENRTGNAGLFDTLSNSNISNLGISGNIIGTNYVGGITGTRAGNALVNINKCHFNGYLKGECAGGIIGSYPNSACKAIVDGCYNSGNIEGKIAGGIIGDECICIVINSYNLGNIKGTERAGGILGLVNGSVEVRNSYNIGNIISDLRAGGIIGLSYSGSTIKNAYNIGSVNPIGNNALFTKASWVTVNVDNGFYIDSTDVKGINIINDTTTSFDKDYIKSQEIVNKLNEYVNTYNEEHKNDEDFVPLHRWKYIAGNYPTFE